MLKYEETTTYFQFEIEIFDEVFFTFLAVNC